MVFYIFFFSFFFKKHSARKQWRSDQMPHAAESDLYLYCLPVSHRKEARLIWIKDIHVS